MKRKISKLFLFEIILYLNILLFVSSLLLTGKYNSFTGLIIGLCIWAIIFIGISIALLMDTIALVKNKNKNLLMRQMKRIKYFSIPYFIFNFILLGSLLFIAVVVTRGALIILVPISFMLTYVVLIPTSFYGIGFLLVLFTEGKISIKKFVLYIILHFCFVLDIVSTILLVKNYGKFVLSEKDSMSEKG